MSTLVEVVHAVSEPELTGSIKVLMDRVLAWEKEFAEDEGLTIYRKTPNAPQFPALWNYFSGERPTQQMDLSRQREFITLVIVVAISHTDIIEEQSLLDGYADLVRSHTDSTLYQKAPFGAKSAQRVGMRDVVRALASGVTALTTEFPVQIQIDRHIHPTIAQEG